LVDLQRMAYPHKWSPISCKSSAGQRKATGQRPMLYRWTTQPTRGMADVQSATAEIRRGKNELECGPMFNVMAAQPNIGGALCESSVIPFLVARCKVWLKPATGVSCSNAPNIRKRKTWTQREFCTWQNSVRGKNLQNVFLVYIVYQPRRRPKIVQSSVGLR